MYFVVSVLPSSTTSGGVLPASAASSLVRWSGHVWYCTLTSVEGCFALNAVVAAATASGHPCCASVCSHTVIDAGSAALLLLLVEAGDAAAAAGHERHGGQGHHGYQLRPFHRDLLVASPERSEDGVPDGRHPHWCRPLGEESVKTTGTVK